MTNPNGSSIQDKIWYQSSRSIIFINFRFFHHPSSLYSYFLDSFRGKKREKEMEKKRKERKMKKKKANMMEKRTGNLKKLTIIVIIMPWWKHHLQPWLIQQYLSHCQLPFFQPSQVTNHATRSRLLIRSNKIYLSIPLPLPFQTNIDKPSH